MRAVPWIAVLVLGSVHVGTAHVGSRVYPIWELPTHSLPDLHDGTIADWEEAVPSPTVELMDLDELNGGPLDLSSLAGRVFLGWSDAEQRIYFAVEQVDDDYVNFFQGFDSEDMHSKHVYDIQKYDHVELMVDGDHSGDVYFPYIDEGYSDEEYAQLADNQAQCYLLIAESPDDIIGVREGIKRWATRLPWAEVGGSQVDETPSYSLIEGFITPWDALVLSGPEQSERSALDAGKIIGFQIILADTDGRPGPGRSDGLYSVAGGWFAWRTAELMVDGMLMPLGVDPAIGVDSAVMRDSWARIKASFR